MKGYGLLIRKARETRGLTPEELAERMGRTKSTIYRMEDEETEPSVEQINALTAALPLSAEELLKAMGVNLSLPLAARLPRPLLEDLAGLSMEQHQTLMDLLRWSKGGGQT